MCPKTIKILAKTCEESKLINRISEIFPIAKFFLLIIGKISRIFEIFVTLISYNKIKPQYVVYYFSFNNENIIENGIRYKK